MALTCTRSKHGKCCLCLFVYAYLPLCGTERQIGWTPKYATLQFQTIVIIIPAGNSEYLILLPLRLTFTFSSWILMILVLQGLGSPPPPPSPPVAVVPVVAGSQGRQALDWTV